MGEKFAEHEGMIRFGVIAGKSHIFIHVEGDHILKAVHEYYLRHGTGLKRVLDSR
jgi:hypothetical protein